MCDLLADLSDCEMIGCKNLTHFKDNGQWVRKCDEFGWHEASIYKKEAATCTKRKEPHICSADVAPGMGIVGG